MNLKRTCISGLSICMFIFLGCSTVQINGEGADNKDLKTAVQNFWQHTVDGNFGKAMYYENLYYNKKIDEAYYSKTVTGGGIIVKGFKILEIEKEGTGPEGSTPVYLALKQSYPTAPFPVPEIMTIKHRDLWIKREDDRWYHLRQKLTGNY